MSNSNQVTETENQDIQNIQNGEFGLNFQFGPNLQYGQIFRFGQDNQYAENFEYDESDEDFDYDDDFEYVQEMNYVPRAPRRLDMCPTMVQARQRLVAIHKEREARLTLRRCRKGVLQIKAIRRNYRNLLAQAALNQSRSKVKIPLIIIGGIALSCFLISKISKLL